MLLYREAMAAKGLIMITGERVLLQNLERAENLFIGLSPSLPKFTFHNALKDGFDFIATSDNYYPRAEDKEIYRIVIKRSDTQTYPMYILDDEEWKNSVKKIVGDQINQIKIALANRNNAFAMCKAEMKTATMLTPEKPQTLRQICIAGAKRLNIDLTNPIYAARLDRELNLIAEKNFEDYFYILSDMMTWAKQRMICGPARGSSAGSLVCLLLNITAIDPISYNLIFERFIDVTRKDLPDIDVDFSDAHRAEVFDYVERKYGKERVARLGTVGMFQPRSVLNIAGAALKIPKWRIEKVLDAQIERSSGDSRALQQLEDTLNDTTDGRKLLAEYPEVAIAAKIEGHPFNASQHAAGIVITQDPVAEYVAIDKRTNSAMCDKYDAEHLNLLKIDALGLTQLSIFERTLELIGEKPISGWLEKLPMNDPAAFKVLNKGHFSGIFQFMGGALKSLTKQFKVTHLEDMIAITALARPGPMATGGANSWVKRKTGREPIIYPHPMLEPYLKDTLGIVIYQEQVLTIGREIGELSWDDVTQLRKAMSKSLGEEYFNKWGDPFKAASIKKGIPKEVVDKFWKDLCGFGSWAFNRSHSVAYGIVSYYCCYLKAHYPVEFAAATLDAEKDPGRQIQLLRELHFEGIDYVPVDAEHSIDRWVPVERDGKKILVGPLTAIKGIGPTSVKTIIAHRNGGRDKSLPPSMLKKLESAKTDIDTIFPVSDAIAKIDLEALNIFSKPVPVSSVQCGVNGEFMVFAVITKIAPKDENEAVNIAKRNGKVLTGPTQALNMFVRDDTDEIFCKINRFAFEKLGQAVVNRGRTGKALYAIRGICPPSFRMISVNNIRYLGDIDEGHEQNLYRKKPTSKDSEMIDP